MMAMGMAWANVALLMAAVSAGGAAEEGWYRSPALAVMTGFIYEPLKPYTIREWDRGLGSRFDADRWAADFQDAGASYLIFYDKWIDGFVFHDTKTTAFKSHREFVRPLAEACRRRGLRLVLYFNAVSDGNPEFDEWAIRDRRGEPVVFSPNWPTRYQTLASPFRRVAVEQARELLTGWGAIDGLWLDIFGERADESNPWMKRAYEEAFGLSPDRDGGARLGELHLRLLADYIEDVRAIARANRPACVFTANGSSQPMVEGGAWARAIGDRLDWTSVEGHSFDAIERLGRLAWMEAKPMEIGLLLNTTWFTPMEDAPPPAAMTARRAIASAAVGLCQGASIYLALTPGHAGSFGGDLEAAKAIGAWFRGVRPLLEGAEPFADAGIAPGAIDQTIAIQESLERAGIFARALSPRASADAWAGALGGLRAVILPEGAVLDDRRIEALRGYVRKGGRLIALGGACRSEGDGLADVLGARRRGEVAFAAPKPAVVRVDSEYSPQFAGRNLIDESPAAWASADSPMPHWAEITLPEVVEVARVELASRRDGPYLVADFDVEAHEGTEWKLVEAIRGATARSVAVPLDRPIRTDRIRVTVRRELYDGRDRRLADVEAIRILDAEGRNRAVDAPPPVRVVATTKAWREAAGEEPIRILPKAVGVEPVTAEILARADSEAGPALILRNRFGEGEAILIAAGEPAFRDAPAMWTALRRLVLGEPTVVCGGGDRYRIILIRIGDRHALHVIDRTEGAAEDVAVAVRTAIGDGGFSRFVVRPDPVATVVLER